MQWNRNGAHRAPFALAASLAAVLLQAQEVDKYAFEPSGQWLERRLTGRDDTVPREASAPYPTVTNLSIEWTIDGDDNLNGVVRVSYRRAGDRNWKHGMPLRRVPARIFKDTDPRTCFWPWENKHSGSILDLEPDTEYEVLLELSDPDGGDARKTLRARTRPVPRAMPEARVKRVTVETFRQEAERAEPGDILLLAPGNYGYFHATRDGQTGKPIVFRADPHDLRERTLPPGSRTGHREFAMFNGISLAGRKHVYLEGLLSTDSISLFNAEECVVHRSIVHAVWGIVSGWSPKLHEYAPQLVSRLAPRPDMALFIGREQARKAVPPHSRNCYIADNIIIGVTPWTAEALHVGGKNLGEGIEISGPGNVVCHNRVVGFRDCISLMEGAKAYDQTSIDIYNNDIYSGADDGIEADFSMSNCRIMRNRVTNCMRGIAAAPVLGGPLYLIRNVLYNTEHLWQTGRAGAGYVVLHNTSIKRGRALSIETHLHSWLRNNLFFGTCDSGDRLVAAVVFAEGKAGIRLHPTWDFDYNGYGSDGACFRGDIGGMEFDSVETLRARTTEKHGVRVSSDDFEKRVRIPSRLFPEQAPADLRLKSGGAAVDAGEVIPNVNDGFRGKAPDLGAYEIGEAPPVYGPRPPDRDANRKELLR